MGLVVQESGARQRPRPIGSCTMCGGAPQLRTSGSPCRTGDARILASPMTKTQGSPPSCHHRSDMAIADRYTLGASAVVLNGSTGCRHHLEAAAAFFWEFWMGRDELNREIWMPGQW